MLESCQTSAADLRVLEGSATPRTTPPGPGALYLLRQPRALEKKANSKERQQNLSGLRGALKVVSWVVAKESL